MGLILDAVQQHAQASPDRIALKGAVCEYSYQELAQSISVLSEQLRTAGMPMLGLLADNGPAWVIVDLCCQATGFPLIPLPGFFSTQQIFHVVKSTGMSAVISDQPQFFGLAEKTERLYFGQELFLHRLSGGDCASLHANTSKVTFTSGSTGTPKGVCLSGENMDRTAVALDQVLANVDMSRHLCSLPLSALLENVAGVYRTLLRGDTAIIPSLSELGFTGSSGLDIARFADCISREQPQSLILLPQMLKSLLEHMANAGWQAPTSLEFVAVGGGRVSPELIFTARDKGLPVYEGYGLSECGSVVALNRPRADRPGSVGEVLPHCHTEIINGEICISGNGFLGYLGEAPAGPVVCTGDLGRKEDDFLIITGRRKNLLISSFGRNISPEWPESELLGSELIQQCVVVGDARPYCAALLWPAPGVKPTAIEAYLLVANSRLPDYAQIKTWKSLPEPMSVANGELTANGRVRRDVIVRHHGQLIDTLYPDVSGSSFMNSAATDSGFYSELQLQTEDARQSLYAIDFIVRGTQGRLSLQEYIAFLTQAYYHVKHTVPLLMACGSRLSDEQEWLREAIAEYIGEETGHQEWILNDIAACGGDSESVRLGKPNASTELMLAYAYDSIARGNAVSFFGMVQVLEGTSIAVADKAAEAIGSSLSLPHNAFSYLRSHGALDVDHVEFFKGLMNRIDKPEDRHAILHSAKMFYLLYGNIFRELGNANYSSLAA